MKLAEALSIRKDLQKRIDQISERINNNVKVQEGDQPNENPKELFAELDACLRQLQDIIYTRSKVSRSRSLWRSATCSA